MNDFNVSYEIKKSRDIVTVIINVFCESTQKNILFQVCCYKMKRIEVQNIKKY